MGILTAATFRSNKIAGCPSMADEDLKSSGGGSFDYRINLNQSYCIVLYSFFILGKKQ